MTNIKGFPKVLYKGNSTNNQFKVKQKINGVESYYTFQVGDIVKVGIKEAVQDVTYLLSKEIVVATSADSIQMVLTNEETANLPENKRAVLEVTLIYNNGVSVKTVYQDMIELKGVVNDG